MSKIKAFIPNLLTLGNLLCGVLAIFVLLRPESTLIQVAFFILLAGIFDLLDGMVARFLGVESPLGAELDSLSDIVSFGVAPTLMILSQVSSVLPSNTWGFLLAIPLCFPTLCGAYRLARFNITSSHATEFKGMPIPANGLFWVGFAFFFRALIQSFEWSLGIYLLLLLPAVVMGLLMVSRIRFLSLKGLTWKTPQGKIVLLAWAALFLLLIGSVAVSGIGGLSSFVLCYALLSIILYRFNKRRNSSTNDISMSDN